MNFIFPTKTKPVSLTGRACALNCAHCGRHYLEHMTSTEDMQKAQHGEIASVLVSGGCGKNGDVPLLDYEKEITGLKKKYSVVAHTGLFAPENASRLKGLADVVSFDFPPSDDAIRDVFGLEKKREDYIESLSSVMKILPTVPHLTIGINGGKISGENESLKILSSLGLKNIVLNVFVPTPGTRFAERKPPEIAGVHAVIKEARDRFDTVCLGCVRPAGGYRAELDKLALGIVDGIVMPSKNVMAKIPDAKIFRECCALWLVAG